jgi:hypothetical protein
MVLEVKAKVSYKHKQILAGLNKLIGSLPPFDNWLQRQYNLFFFERIIIQNIDENIICVVKINRYTTFW